MKLTWTKSAALIAVLVMPLAACGTNSGSGGARPADNGFPKKGQTITMINPSDAGTSSDLGYRDLLKHAEDELGVNIETINRAGSGTQIGLNQIVAAKPDGYTIGSTALPTTIGVYMDPARGATFKRDSFVPVMQHVFDPGATAVKKDSPYSTMKELVAAAIAKPGEIKIIAGGRNSRQHLDILALQEATGAEFRIVHADSSANPLTLLLSGDVDAMHESVGDMASPVKNGEVKLLGVWDDAESPFAKGVPTLKSQGYDLVSGSSRVISAPAGTPKDVVEKLATALMTAAENPEHKKFMESSGLQIKPLGSEDVAQKWEKLEENFAALTGMEKK